MCEDKEKSERKRTEEKIVFRKGRLEHASVPKGRLRGRGGVGEENRGLCMKQVPSEGGRGGPLPWGGRRLPLALG